MNEQETTMSNEQQESQVDKPEIESGTRVYVDTIPDEDLHGVIGVVCRESDDLRIAETDDVFPFDRDSAALHAAESLALRHGWEVVQHMTNMRVYLDTATVGQAFGTVGLVRRVGSGRIVAETADVFPYGFDYAARRAARTHALRRGWVVIDDSSDD